MLPLRSRRARLVVVVAVILHQLCSSSLFGVSVLTLRSRRARFAAEEFCEECFKKVVNSLEELDYLDGVLTSSSETDVGMAGSDLETESSSSSSSSP